MANLLTIDQILKELGAKPKCLFECGKQLTGPLKSTYTFEIHSKKPGYIFIMSLAHNFEEELSKEEFLKDYEGYYTIDQIIE